MLIANNQSYLEIPKRSHDNIDLSTTLQWSVVVPEATTNLFLNPSFEFTTYAVGQRNFNATVTQVVATEYSSQGQASMKMVPGTLINSGLSLGFGKKKLGYALSSDYTFSADVKANINDRVLLRVQSWDFLDEFSRADNASSVGIPDSVTTTPNWINGIGTWGISSRKIYNTSDTTGDTLYLIDTGIKDGFTEINASGQVATNVSTGPGRYPALVFRYNPSSGSGLMVHVTDTRVVLRSFSGSTPGAIMASFTLPGTVINGQEYILSANANGNVINFAASGPCSGSTYASYSPMGQGIYTLTGGEPALYNTANNTRPGAYLIKAGSPTTPPVRWDNFRQSTNVTGTPTSLVERSLTMYTELQRLAVTFTTPATLPPGLEFQILKIQGSTTLQWYTDAWQLENKNYPTSYIDGSLYGGIWQGTVNQSPSQRLANYAGGREYTFNTLNIPVTGQVTFGLIDPKNQSMQYGLLGGSILQRTTLETRVLALPVALRATNQLDYYTKRQTLISLFAPSNSNQLAKPLILRQQVLNCGIPITQPLEMQVIYGGGLDGNEVSPFHEDLVLQFIEYLPPSIQELQQQYASVFNVTTGITDVQFLYFYQNGAWSYNPVPGSIDTPQGIAYDQDGLLWNMGLSTAQAINLVTNTVDVNQAVTPINTGAQVIISPQNVPIFMGNFTTPQTRIMQYQASTNSFIAVGAGGFNAIINDAVYDTTGNLVVVGDFTAPATRAALWNGSAWAALYGAGPNAQVFCIIRHPDGGFVIGGGGAMTSVAGLTGVAVFKTTNPATGLGANSNMNGGANGQVRCLAIGPDGYVYAGGLFTTAGGITCNRIAKWNGSQWQPLGVGLNGTVFGMAFDPQGKLWVVGSFTALASGVNTINRFIAIWDGSRWQPAPILLSSVSSGYSRIIIQPSGKVTINQNNGGGGGTHIMPTTTTTKFNGSTADVYPSIVMSNVAGSGTVNLYSISNITTGKTLYFSLSLQVGEKVVLTLQPTLISMVSNYTGNVLGKLLEGSDTTFALVPGNNVISTAGDNLAVIVEFYYHNTHFSFDAAAQAG
jgi:hypothetical protein